MLLFYLLLNLLCLKKGLEIVDMSQLPFGWMKFPSPLLISHQHQRYYLVICTQAHTYTYIYIHNTYVHTHTHAHKYADTDTHTPG